MLGMGYASKIPSTSKLSSHVIIPGKVIKSLVVLFIRSLPKPVAHLHKPRGNFQGTVAFFAIIKGSEGGGIKIIKINNVKFET